MWFIAAGIVICREYLPHYTGLHLGASAICGLYSALMQVSHMLIPVMTMDVFLPIS
jgi:hypothetical protein